MFINNIVRTIEIHAQNGTYIFIDEIPIANSKDFQLFADGIAAIVIGLANRKVRSTKLLLSSIENAKPYIKEFQKKVLQHVRFIELVRWREDEIASLLSHLLRLIGLKFGKGAQWKIVQAADGCPRRLKRILKMLWTHQGSDNWSFDRILSECRCL